MTHSVTKWSEKSQNDEAMTVKGVRCSCGVELSVETYPAGFDYTDRMLEDAVREHLIQAVRR